MKIYRDENFLDYSLFSGDLERITSTSSLVINTINQYSFCMAQLDAGFKAALQNSDVLLPDGVAIVAAMRLLSNQKIKKIAGADIHRHLLEDLNKRKGSCFYLGSSEPTLQKIRQRVEAEYPDVRIETYSPPYKAEFSAEDNEQMIAAINSFSPDVLFVGMTAPKQEKWIDVNKNKLNINISCTIGAVFDFYAGTIERPGQVWIDMGLEWFVRLVKEPGRMWRRYIYYGPVFVWLMIKEKLRT